MILSFAVLAVLACIATGWACRKGDGSHIKGIKEAGKTFVNIAPLLFLAFIMAGFLQVVIPPEFIRGWLGEESGIRGVFVGSIAGALVPGGPYIAFPVIASVFQAGAGLGTAVAFVTGWAMWGLLSIPFELAILGTRFVILRLALVSVVPPLAGIMAYLFF